MSSLRALLFGIPVTLCAALLLGCGEADAPQSHPPDTAEAAASDAPALGPKVFPIESAPVLDNRGRDEWQRPREVVEALGIEPGMCVADIGCGTGYFTVRLVQAAAPDGRVIAVDIQQGMLDILEGRLSPADAERVELRLSAPDRPLAPDDDVDLALCANTLHEVDDAAAFVQCMADGLAPGGRLALINWRRTKTPFGPPLEHRLAPARIAKMAADAGLVADRSVDLLRMHSFLIYRKPER